MHADYRSAAGLLVDDVLFTFFRGPHSYTGEDSLEVSCHGNPFIAQKILEDLLKRGCRLAGPGEFTQRAFLNGRMDLSQAEAVMDLIHARSERALAAANRQLRGALGHRMKEMIDRLLSALAQIEAYIDFPEEDLPSEDRGHVIGELNYLARETDRLLATSHYGELLRDGIKTVILGPPNAGKSSLLNRLVGRQRALVSPEPGTTRDFIEERILIGPHCLRLIDTAGLNSKPAELEKLGIEKTMERLAEADLILLVLDASRPTPPLSTTVLDGLGDRTTITILNKVDLLSGESIALPPAQTTVVRFSALTGLGLDELTAAVIGLADAFQENVGEDLVAINARHAHALNRARVSLQEALFKLTTGDAVELVASELREVLDAFGEISGKVDNEQMLDRLFASFCIGK
jgi:tRNA modification GTPase